MITLPLKDMSLNEKFMVIEMIWDDICHRSADFTSPAWHETVLKERDEKIAADVKKCAADFDVRFQNLDIKTL